MQNMKKKTTILTSAVLLAVTAFGIGTVSAQNAADGQQEGQVSERRAAMEERMQERRAEAETRREERRAEFAAANPELAGRT